MKAGSLRNFAARSRNRDAQETYLIIDKQKFLFRSLEARMVLTKTVLEKSQNFLLSRKVLNKFKLIGVQSAYRTFTY